MQNLQIVADKGKNILVAKLTAAQDYMLSISNYDRDEAMGELRYGAYILLALIYGLAMDDLLLISLLLEVAADYRPQNPTLVLSRLIEDFKLDKEMLERAQNKLHWLSDSGATSVPEHIQSLLSELALQSGVDTASRLDSTEAEEMRLLYAVSTNDVTSLEELVEAGVEVNRSDSFGRSPLHWAAINGHLPEVQKLVAAGGEVNSRDSDGCTPLHLAASRGHLRVVQKLVEAGGEVNSRGGIGLTPLHWAAREGHLTVVQKLVEAGGEVNGRCSDGWTPLRFAADWGYTEVVSWLRSRGGVR